MISHLYHATVDRVIDGDTLICNVDLGFHCYAKVHVRLLGINTPELNSRDQMERLKAQDAKLFLTNMLKDKTFVLRSSKTEKFGRWLGEIFIDDLNVANVMLFNGLGVPYEP